MKIWVDDIRTPPSEDYYRKDTNPDGWVWCANSSHAIAVLTIHRNWGDSIEIMSLDHDLGGNDTTRRIVLWCCENDFWPNEVVVHSANPVGREWLEGMIERYKN